jgi:NADH-quinone oxidoreductase subunit M
MISTLLLLPLIGTLLLVMLPKLKNDELNKEFIKIVSSVTASTTFCYSIWLLLQYDVQNLNFQFYEKLTWFSEYLHFIILAVDGISLIFIILTTLITFLVIISINYNDKLQQHPFYKIYFVCLFAIEFFLLGAFSVLDIFIFYIFFESILIPMFFIIGIWGSGYRKIKANYYFFLYTLVGSLFMLFAIALVIMETGGTNYFKISMWQFPGIKERILWFCIFLSFSVKIPMFPFHIWLPEAHVEAPTEGSVILAALLLKLGGYGFIRYSLVMFPSASFYFSPLVFTLALLGITYSSLTALRQLDMKRIIAYASIAHMNFAVLGIFSGTAEAISGSVFLMFAHGLVSSALFFLVGILYRNYGSRLIYYYGGLAQVMPLFTIFFLFFSFANAGLPGTSNFIGEILIFLGLGEISFFVVLFSCFGFILSIIYSIWLFNRICFGNLRTQYIGFFNDINIIDFIILFILALLTLILGIYPNLLLTLIGDTCSYLRLYNDTFSY